MEALKERLSQFKQVDLHDLIALDFKSQDSIKKALVDEGHWGCAKNTPGSSQCLRDRIETNLSQLEEGGIDRIQVMRFFECVKSLFDTYTKFMDDKDSLPTPPNTLVIDGNDSPSFTVSVGIELLQQGSADPKGIHNLLKYPVHGVFDMNHKRMSWYKHNNMNKPAPKMILDKYLKHVTASRNHFVSTVGHADHVSSLMMAERRLASKMATDRSGWQKWRETMTMIGDCLLVYRVEWGGSEKCPIYSHFEDKYIGYRRGNVDWFICNTLNGSIVWVPDLVVYQVGLFGFIQGEASQYRFDMESYRKTVIEACDACAAKPVPENADPKK